MFISFSMIFYFFTLIFTEGDILFERSFYGVFILIT